MRILIVDDHEYTREGIGRILSENFDVTKVAHVGTYELAMEHMKTGTWDLVVLDINLAGKSGLEVLQSIRTFNASIPILVLSMVPVSQYARRVMQAGASGYVTKSEPAEELLKAVRMLTRGLKYFSPEVQQEIPSLIDETIEHPRHDKLSNRELAVLRGIAEGKSTKEIAAEFKLSLNTVNSYRKRVITKLHIKTNLDLIRYAYQHGLVQ
jgi:DNA-binding NarL/FixJ family response regulator